MGAEGDQSHNAWKRGNVNVGERALSRGVECDEGHFDTIPSARGAELEQKGTGTVGIDTISSWRRARAEGMRVIQHRGEDPDDGNRSKVPRQ